MERDDGILNSKYIDLINFNITDTSICTMVEEKISSIIKNNYCASTCNGTSALYLGMIALGLKEGDEIILPDYSYHAAFVVAKSLKLNIKFCDISENTLCMNPDELVKLINVNTKAIVFINHLGYVGEDLVKISGICKDRDILLIEDSAQAFGHSYNNKYAGTYGDISIFSFSGTKLIRSGEGGCLLTNNLCLFEKVKELRDMGIGNYTLSGIAGKLILSQIYDLENIFLNRKRIQDTYKKYLDIFSFESGTGSIHSAVYISEKAEQVFTFLKSKNIQTRYNFYKSFSPDLSLNISNKVQKNYIELPQSNSLSEEDIKGVCDEIKNIESLKINSSLLDKLNKLKRR